MQFVMDIIVNITKIEEVLFGFILEFGKKIRRFSTFNS